MHWQGVMLTHLSTQMHWQGMMAGLASVTWHVGRCAAVWGWRFQALPEPPVLHAGLGPHRVFGHRCVGL
eukprot:scaffold56781_cov22-Tisochrysis_lutea.AAC.1